MALAMPVPTGAGGARPPWSSRRPRLTTLVVPEGDNAWCGVSLCNGDFVTHQVSHVRAQASTLGERTGCRWPCRNGTATAAHASTTQAASTPAKPRPPPPPPPAPSLHCAGARCVALHHRRSSSGGYSPLLPPPVTGAASAVVARWGMLHTAVNMRGRCRHRLTCRSACMRHADYRPRVAGRQPLARRSRMRCERVVVIHATPRLHPHHRRLQASWAGRWATPALLAALAGLAYSDASARQRFRARSRAACCACVRTCC
jgi:hypothetical protein